MDAVINLTFHGVGQPERAISPAEQSVWLSETFFNETLNLLVGRPRLLITFDDGNRSDVQISLPALQERSLKATFFVLAGRIGSDGYLSAGDLRMMRRAGMEVGLHGMHHVAWGGLDEAGLTVELSDARRRIEDILGERVRSAACPFGSYGRRSLGALRRCQFDRVYTSDRAPGTRNAWLQPRYTIRSSDNLNSVRNVVESHERQPRLLHRARMLVKRWR